jgi:uncharacterized protein (TIGR02996 family)
MLTLTERNPHAAERRRESPLNRVRFAAYREPRGRSAQSPPKLRVYYESEAEQSFAVLARFADGRYALQVTGGDLAVLLNGRPIVPGDSASASDGDVVRIGEWRFVVGQVPDFPRDGTEASLLDALRARPWDDDLRRVYGDWLEERGDVAYAEFLRVELQIKGAAADDPALPGLASRFHDAANDVPSRAWRLLVARPIIERCDVKLELACPKRWDGLARTGADNVRRCDACGKDVTFCGSIEAARLIARRGGCVAIDPALARHPDDLDPPSRVMLGAITLPREPE